ncbi:MAG: hypothetical protein AB1454_09265 [Candidatus Auribacterota bacterium]
MKKFVAITVMFCAFFCTKSGYSADETIDVVAYFGTGAVIAVYADNSSSTILNEIVLNTANLNTYFPNSTDHFITGVAGRAFLKVSAATSAWDVSMFTTNPVSTSGLLHEIFTNEYISIKYRASTWAESYDSGTLVDGLVGTGSGQAAYDAFTSGRWMVNSTAGTFAGLAQDDKGYSMVASGDMSVLNSWDYLNNRVEIIYILGLPPGLDAQQQPIPTADQPGVYETTIGFEVVNF